MRDAQTEGLVAEGSRVGNPAAADPVSSEDRPPWLFEGSNMMACRCDFCPALGPWAEGADAAEAAALAAGWLGEKDDELDTEGALVCRTVTWVCPACRPAFTTEDTENGG